MKKKIALLLAFVMMLSLLPMNVFGAVQLLPNNAPLIPFSDKGPAITLADSPQFVRSLRFNSDDFYVPNGFSSYESHFLLSIEDAQKWEIPAGIYPPNIVSGAGIGVEVKKVTGSDTELEVIVTKYVSIDAVSGAVYTGPNQFVEIPLEYTQVATRGWGNTSVRAVLRALSDNFYGNEVLTFTLARYDRTARGISMSYPSDQVRRFSTRQIYDASNRDATIRLTENEKGTFQEGNMNVKLILPAGFAWTSGTSSSITATASRGGTYGLILSSQALNNIRWEAEGRTPASERRAISFNINIAENTSYTNKIADTIRIGGFGIIADDGAKVGEVEVGIWIDNGLNTANGNQWGSVVVANYQLEGISAAVHKDDDINKFELKTGYVDWEWSGSGAIINAEKEYLQTARLVLTENTPGSFGFNGLFGADFTFGEGVQVLGAKIWLNNAKWSRGNDSNFEVWYTNGNENSRTDNAGTLIRDNRVSIRPEIEDLNRQTASTHSVTIEFYLSIAPEYAAKYGDKISVNVSGRALGDFDEDIDLAVVVDPIEVETDPVVLDEVMDASFGRVRYTPVNDVVINELYTGALERGRELILYVEGGVGLRGNTADQISINAASVNVLGDTSLRVSKPYRTNDGGVAVQIERESNDEGAQIVFSGVEISGAIVTGWEYNVIVVGSAVAANWGYTTGRMHGMFQEEPYASPIFSFEGTDYYGTADSAPGTGPSTTAPGTGTSVGTVTGPVLLAETMNWIDYKTGEPLAAPIFRTVPTAPGYVSSYVMVRVVADILGLEWAWDGATKTATFTGRGVVMSLTIDSPVAVVNGTNVPITASGIAVTAQSIDGRLFVPIKFFEEVYEGVTVEWNGVNRTVVVTP